MDESLAQKMIEVANEDNLQNDHEMRVKALELRDAIEGFLAEEQTCSVKRMLGCWARARRVWCEYTGEPLI